MRLSIKEIIGKMAFPSDIKCIVCDGELSVANRFSVCARCALTPNTLFCRVCGRAFTPDGSAEETAEEKETEAAAEEKELHDVCKKCFAEDPAFDAARAAFIYEGEVKNLIYKFKFGNARYLAPYMAEYMLDAFNAFFNEEDLPDLITFVPMYHKKQKSRGYNQAELLANALASKTGLCIYETLERIKEIKNVAKMTRSQREEAIKDSISVKDPSVFMKKSILLVDDVFTTGNTAQECAKQLKFFGAAKVYVLTFATSRA